MPPKHGPGLTLPVSANPCSSLTGISSLHPNAGLWEPYDGRLSRTVLREPGGETPPGHSPDPDGAEMAAAPPPVPPALHPHLRIVEEPGRALVLRPDHQEPRPLRPSQRQRTRRRH